MKERLTLASLWFLNGDGSQEQTGGLQRWCRDLAILARHHGHDVLVVQGAHQGFETEYRPGIRVVGVPRSMGFQGNWQLSRWMLRHLDPKDACVYVSQELAIAGCPQRSMAVNHGIWWDGDMPWHKKRLNKVLQSRLLNKLKAVICVDTNYINWCHAELKGRRAWEQKLFYVPNYADLDRFLPTGEASRQTPELRILFPRRVEGDGLEFQGRGAGLLLKAVELLEAREVRTRLMFVGRGGLQGAIRQWAANHHMEDRVEVFESTLDGMPDQYARADVIVVPSLEHEGTSLSAIEGLVSGVPTVVSHIGGLANIVIPGFNGEMCDLSPESLADAILRAHEERPLERVGLLAACRESLGKPRWEQSVWTHIGKTLAFR